MPINIIIVDDHKLFCEALNSLISTMINARVVGTAFDHESVFNLILEGNVDIVIMDICLPEKDGIEITKEILKEHPNIKVIALSMYSHEYFVQEMFKAGAMGYLLKGCSFDELSTAINKVSTGSKYVERSIEKRILSNYFNSSNSKKINIDQLLTKRECEVLKLIADGYSTKEIAGILSISIKTVTTHKGHLMKKLETDNLADLIKYAIKEGFTLLDRE